MRVFLVLLLLLACGVRRSVQQDRGVDYSYLSFHFNGTVPGITERCNKTAECLPFEERGQMTWDFLCCEDGFGWVAAHSTNPMGVHFFFGDFFISAFVVLFFEVFEVSTLLFFGQFVIFSTSDLELETWAGSLVGDGLLQGGQGIVIAALLKYVLGVPALVPVYSSVPVQKCRLFWLFPMRCRWLWFKYFGLWLLYALNFIWLSLIIENEEYVLNLGLLICTACLLVLLWLVYPWAMSGRADKQYVWRGVSSTRRRLFFGAWGLIVLAMHLQTIGVWEYLPNDYFQVWVSEWTIIVLLSLLALQKCQYQRGKRRRVTPKRTNV